MMNDAGMMNAEGGMKNLKDALSCSSLIAGLITD
jgi:hypothetical protein